MTYDAYKLASPYEGERDPDEELCDECAELHLADFVHAYEGVFQTKRCETCLAIEDAEW